MKTASRLPSWLACSVLLLPAAILSVLLLKFSVNSPFMDQWDTPGNTIIKMLQGTLTFNDLLLQHNESRMVFPKLLLMTLAFFTRWDVRYEHWATFGMACLTAYNICRLSTSTLQSHSASKHSIAQIGVLLLCNLLIFSAIQCDTWLSGLTVVYFVPIACLTGGVLIARSQLSISQQFWLCGLLATVSTFSYANGMLLWVLLLPILLQSYRVANQPITILKRLLFGWALAFGLNIIVYFYHYQKPSNHPSLLEALRHPIAAIQYLLSFLGTPLGFGDFVAGQIIGAVILILFGVSCGYCWQHRHERAFPRQTLPWLIVGAYTCLSALTIVAARVGFGVKQSMSPRYTTFSLYLIIVVIHLLVLIARNARTSDRVCLQRLLQRWVLLTLALCLVVLHTLSFFYGVRIMASFSRDRLAGKACLLFLNVNPDEECLARNVYPTVPQLQASADQVNRLGLLRPPLLTSRSPQAIADSPAPNPAIGTFASLLPLNGDQLIASGWAVLPDGTAAHGVVLAYEQANGEAIEFAIARPRRKVRLEDDPKGNHAPKGVWQRTFTRGQVPPAAQISAWAIDANRGKAIRLENLHRLPSPVVQPNSGPK